MQPVVRIALVPDSRGKGEAILRTYECLREAGIIGCTYTEPLIMLVPQTRERALAALLAAGFEFKKSSCRLFWSLRRHFR